MIFDHDLLKKEKNEVKILQKILEQMELSQSKKIEEIGELFEINDLQNDYLKSKYLENEKSINKLEKQIERETEKLEMCKKQVSDLYLSKQVQFYDEKMNKQRTELTQIQEVEESGTTDRELNPTEN